VAWAGPASIAASCNISRPVGRPGTGYGVSLPASGGDSAALVRQAGSTILQLESGSYY
jgi:hypothetical protein